MLIHLNSGRSQLYFQGYCFYKRYDGRNFTKWNCTMWPKCSCSINTDANLVVMKTTKGHNHQVRQLRMLQDGRPYVNGKQMFYEGYVFYKQFSAKTFIRWCCTHYPSCSAAVYTDSKMVVMKTSHQHNHPLLFDLNYQYFKEKRHAWKDLVDPPF
ncbi:unnamed protein product [Colias eurytheme]|nr:unnamed protein product [Colias eurytheme]